MGTVSSVHSDAYGIDYDDGDHAMASPESVIPLAAPGTIQVGDHVIAHWKNGVMYPGIVTAAADGRVTVRWDDGDTPLSVAETLVAKIH
ncbi:MAG: hypothetical protein ACXWUG_23270 [Polyangiales bacterium]